MPSLDQPNTKNYIQKYDLRFFVVLWPFVLSCPLLSSAPSIVCPSAAKRSLSVSISLRTDNKKFKLIQK